MALIDSVTPGEGYLIAVCMTGGDKITVNLSSKINTCRFKSLVNRETYYSAKTDGMFVIWNNGEVKLSVSELRQLSNPKV